jgi:hypothetical protein
VLLSAPSLLEAPAEEGPLLVGVRCRATGSGEMRKLSLTWIAAPSIRVGMRRRVEHKVPLWYGMQQLKCS